MKILGLNAGEINSSAALSIDGSIVAGVAEERFNREKRTKIFPDKSIEYCLNHAGIKFDDLDFILFTANNSCTRRNVSTFEFQWMRNIHYWTRLDIYNNGII